ncbi:hypothetical protein CEXT_212541 [Caerostris extrusa]|uniref:Uncharacterized protein n=1 Tax=Caerostris extrusa TaxID=172846 RepID=A0AAV4WTX0_CAEEX|nr:hypothetical protein CEXT_212541 [Caerostris extrusa]
MRWPPLEMSMNKTCSIRSLVNFTVKMCLIFESGRWRPLEKPEPTEVFSSGTPDGRRRGGDFPNPGLVRIILAERRLLWGGLLLHNRSCAPVWPKQISGYGLLRL